MPGVYAKWKKLFKSAIAKFHVKPLEHALFRRAIDGGALEEDISAIYNWHEECRISNAELAGLLAQMSISIVSDEYAYQEFYLADEHLEDSDDLDGNNVPDSVLLSSSQTTMEFNWPETYSQNATILIGPGANVQDHAFVQNLDFQILGFNVEGVDATNFKLTPRRACAMPFFSGGATKKLWIGQFQFDAALPNKVRWQPSSLTANIGTKVTLRARPEQ